MLFEPIGLIKATQKKLEDRPVILLKCSKLLQYFVSIDYLKFFKLSNKFA